MQTGLKVPLAVMLGLVGLGGLPVCGEPPPNASPTISKVDAAGKATADGLIASPEPDWPQWRGPRRDGISAQKGLAPNWPEGGPRLLWKIGQLGRGWSSPIIVRDRLYITGDVDNDLVIFAFDQNGKRGCRIFVLLEQSQR